MSTLTNQARSQADAFQESAEKFYGEWREFALRKNTFDVATGIMIGSALTKIANSLVKDVLTPLIVATWSGAALGESFIVLRAGHAGKMSFQTVAEAQSYGAVTFNYGRFLEALIDFLFVSLAIFLLFKTLTRVKVSARQVVSNAISRRGKNELDAV